MPLLVRAGIDILFTAETFSFLIEHENVFVMSSMLSTKQFNQKLMVMKRCIFAV
jgi:hypothetical protein